MEGGAVAFSNPRTVKDVFKDFKNRRAGILKALTNDVETFTRICDPEKENLCLYGLPNGSWEVNLPAEEVPSELPEPALGINFARDGMQRKDWLSLVAVHSDAWLFAVAFYYGARFDKNEREHLFNMMNDLPTLFDIVTGRKLVKEKASANSGNKTKSTVKVNAAEVQTTKVAKPTPPKEESFEEEDDEDENEDEDEEHGDTFCGSCGGKYTADGFWIGCDVCEKWFHGKCVKISAARAEHIKQYKCPQCIGKRARPS
ncbi:hypothetical protein O6H91_03G034600 [Diphasiastrum complanatum]|uniref:Uncharacterized protein n=3 Tax=Diphasiastrum complanatum TaxID=34168 RepID=A0ACC2E3M0_DIPCM|nr:hypothetical protein O6H91_03G014500 [Diphasiastrum complanatum]KAJ7561590.1 hypothetical protein O6H91_03G034600 [Diphasiastrum complanatum]